MQAPAPSDAVAKQPHSSVSPHNSVVEGGRIVTSNLAVLLDENIKPGGEFQIKRRKRFQDGPPWELTVWEPSDGQYPRILIRVRAYNPLDLFRAFDQELDKIQETEDRRPPIPIGLQMIRQALDLG
jgi:hypothetical protein